MSQGSCEEFDHPYKLLVKDEGDKELTNVDGYFARMVRATGHSAAKSLFDIAYQTYHNGEGR